MPLDGGARWEIQIRAADQTAAAFASVDRRIKGMDQHVGALSGSVQQLATTGAGVLTLARNLKQLAVAYGVMQAAQHVLNVGMRSGALIDQAAQLGVSTDALQAYRLAAAQSGVEAEQFDSALQRLTGQLGQARAGSDEAIDRFDRLGVKILDARGQLRPVSDLLPEVARGLLSVSSETERNALAQEFFGRSGARVVTMLETLARGTGAVTAAARLQNAVIERDTLEAWNKLDAQMKVTTASADAAFAALGAPIATWSLKQVNDLLQFITEKLVHIQRYEQMGGSRGAQKRREAGAWLEDEVATLEEQQKRLQESLSKPYRGGARADAIREQLSGVTERLDKARADYAEWQRTSLNEAVNRQLGLPTIPPPVSKDDFRPKGGTTKPTGKQAGAAAHKLDVRLKELQTEREALEKALAAFDTRGIESVAEVDRRLDAQVKLDKKIFDVLKDVPPNSALAQQLTQEATAISQLNQQLEERKRLLIEGEQVTAKFGDGSAEKARGTAQLDKLLAAGAIDPATHVRAMQDLTQRAAEMDRAFRGAQGGWTGFQAGLEQGLADLDRANSAFEIGKTAVDQLSDALSQMATGAEVNFNKILQSFLSMLIQMEMKAAMSSIFSLIGLGGGSGGGGLGGILGNVIGGLFGGGGDYFSAGPIAVGGIPTIALAGGGRYEAGVPRITGENGWELDVPDRGGTVYNQDQLREMLGGGGGGSVIVQQTVYTGTVVSQAQHEADMRRVREEAKAGAIAGVLEAKSRGGEYRGMMRR